jgi:hypothetical protein
LKKSKPDFDKLTFDAFRQLAKDPCLSRHEKVGFPDAYREGKEEAIFRDICTKLSSLRDRGKTILEIGPGCSQLPVMLAELCEERGHRLMFVDSAEMLSHLPDKPLIIKYPGCYPDLPDFHDQYTGQIDAILAYSVIQYIFAEGNLWNVLDRLMLLLKDGGEILLGDIPNISMRKRFFDSAAGWLCHRNYTGKDEKPEVCFNQPEVDCIDDSVVLGLISRSRAAGFHAWALPQAKDLPMANRREDILIRKP